VVVVPGDGQGLSRSWVYTAFGRGERHVSVVQGAEQQRLAAAVAGPHAKERTTRLRSVLTELAAEG
jgi:ATP-dependent exoDNAse (exonuclease V) alpha subunit